MQKSIPCDEQDWWDFKQLALDNKMGLKEYFHYIVQVRKTEGSDK